MKRNSRVVIPAGIAVLSFKSEGRNGMNEPPKLKEFGGKIL
jgi:hypothetical protein